MASRNDALRLSVGIYEEDGRTILGREDSAVIAGGEGEV
jgi:hypothetical protein